jgi:hypothetical protein
VRTVEKDHALTAAPIGLERDHLAPKDIVFDHERAEISKETRRHFGYRRNRLHNEPADRPDLIASPEKNAQRAVGRGHEKNCPGQTGKRQLRPDGRIHVLGRAGSMV